MPDKSKVEFQQLLLAMADEFENLSSPFAGNFLSHHEVTLNDCASASEMIAHLLRSYVRSPEWVQIAMTAAGIIGDMEGVDTEFLWLRAIQARQLERLNEI